MLKSGFWQDLTSDQLQGVDPEKTIAILPVSAVEQHGPHLPLSTDAVIEEGTVEQGLRAVPNTLTVLALPALTIGHSLEHTGGGISKNRGRSKQTHPPHNAVLAHPMPETGADVKHE